MARLGGKVIVIVWNFWKCLLGDWIWVVGTFNDRGGEGVGTSEPEEEVGMGG